MKGAYHYPVKRVHIKLRVALYFSFLFTSSCLFQAQNIHSIAEMYGHS